uniref:WD40 repeat domain-containing protein n=1 Tax=Herbidospora sakaeratensis TaxID=564415 RepID=UPI0014713494|nr:hypothetical protein [Herbidospora sakaeratensis]
MRGHAADGVVTAAFSPDGTLLATGGHDNTIRLWDVRARRPIGLPFQHAGDLPAVAFDADGRTVRTADASGAVHAEDAEGGLPPGGLPAVIHLARDFFGLVE